MEMSGKSYASVALSLRIYPLNRGLGGLIGGVDAVHNVDIS